MAILYLVRHGKAAATWEESLDPGLDQLGREQAETVANKLANLNPIPIFTSPLARTQQTSRPLAQQWNCEPMIEDRVAEIPSPNFGIGGSGPKHRKEWLNQILHDQWQNLSKDLQTWRQNLIDVLLEFSSDCVIFSHFVAINAAVGQATSNNRVVSFYPDNGSITMIESSDSGLRLIEKGSEMYTHVG